jgi:hypothetical protein
MIEMNVCDNISSMIPEYINKSTSAEQNRAIARHMASCPACRADLALWLSVEKSLQFSTEPAISLDCRRIFDKLPEKETELEKILKAGLFNIAFGITRYIFSTISDTYRLAGLV